MNRRRSRRSIDLDQMATELLGGKHPLIWFAANYPHFKQINSDGGLTVNDDYGNPLSIGLGIEDRYLAEIIEPECGGPVEADRASRDARYAELVSNAAPDNKIDSGLKTIEKTVDTVYGKRVVRDLDPGKASPAERERALRCIRKTPGPYKHSPGDIYGDFTLIETDKRTKKYIVECSCGQKHSLWNSQLRKGICPNKNKKYGIGKTFGSLTIIERYSSGSFNVSCKCGSNHDVTKYKLIKGECPDG